MIGRRGSAARAINVSIAASVIASCAAVLLGRASPAAAQAESAAAPSPRQQRIVLFAPTADDPLAERIGAELTALGLEVSHAAIPPAAVIEETVRQALAAGARAAVIADGTRTEVWIAQDNSDRVTVRQELEIGDMHGLQSVLALRTVELMRVSLGLVTPMIPPPPPAVVVAPPALPPAAPESPVDRFSLDVSTGAVASSGRLGPFPLVGVSLGAQLWEWLGIELRGYIPIEDRSVSDVDGAVSSSVWLIGAGVTAMSQGARRIALEAGVGTMAAILHTVGSGTGTAPDTGHTDDAVGVVVYGRGAARFQIASRWWLRVDLLGGAALRRPTIAVSTSAGTLDHDVTTWGKVFGAGLGGAELRF